MTIGKMRHRIELQQNQRVSDGYGGVSNDWETQSTVWAQIVPKSSVNDFENDIIKSEVTHDIRIRYHADIHHSWRVKYGTRLFNIQSVINTDERKRFTMLKCKEGVAV